MAPIHDRGPAILLAVLCAVAGVLLLVMVVTGESGRMTVDPLPPASPTAGPSFLSLPPRIWSRQPCGDPRDSEGPSDRAAFITHIIEHDDDDLLSSVGFGYLAESRLLAVGVEGEHGLEMGELTLFGDSRGRVSLGIGNIRKFAVARGDEQSLLVGVDPQSQFLSIIGLSSGPEPSFGAAPSYVDLRGLRLGSVSAIAASSDGALVVVLDAENGRLVRLSMRPAPSEPLDLRLHAACEIRLAAPDTVAALAVSPVDNDIYLLAREPELAILRLDQEGQLAASHSLADADVADLTAMVFAPSADPTDPPDTEHVYLLEEADGRATRVVAVAWEGQPEPPPDVDLVPELVSVIRAFAWSPPSGDPTGIAWDRRARHFVVTDSEIDELATYAGSNLWFMNVRGSVLRSGLLRRTSEPTDVAIDPSTGTLFVSDDGKKRILVVAAGADGRFGTADDSVASLPTQDFGSKDPEGLAFGQGTLFVADGTGREVYRLSPGPNGRFDGVPPRGDDQVFSFDVAQLGLLDPEGIAFSPGQATLYILDRARNGPLMEVSTAGALIRSIDLASLGLVSPSGLAFGPASDGSDRISIYITDRGTDNARNPFENDGRVLEVRVPGVP